MQRASDGVPGDPAASLAAAGGAQGSRTRCQAARIRVVRQAMLRMPRMPPRRCDGEQAAVSPPSAVGTRGREVRSGKLPSKPPGVLRSLRYRVDIEIGSNQGNMHTELLSIDAVNALSEADFTARFGDVAERSPWVAETAAHARPFADRPALIAAFADAVRTALPEAQLALLRAHPDLADRAAIAGDGIAAESRREQAGAGLDRLTAAEFARFGDLNTRYRERFGFRSSSRSRAPPRKRSWPRSRRVSTTRPPPSGRWRWPTWRTSSGSASRIGWRRERAG